MKNYLIAVYIFLLLAGCASAAFKEARSNANLVKNGMTVDYAIHLIGIPPTDKTATLLEWRRGNAKNYNATPNGAIQFHVKDGIVVDVPDGGIFGPEAQRLFAEAWAAQRDHQRVLAEQSAKAVSERYAAEIREAVEAEKDAKIACNVKSTCAKIFALAQIYIATETDQKIQVVTDSVIQTYNPTEVGNVGASIIKMPQRDDDAVVSLTLMCKANTLTESESICRAKKNRLYRGFRPFIESRLTQ